MLCVCLQCKLYQGKKIKDWVLKPLMYYDSFLLLGRVVRSEENRKKMKEHEDENYKKEKGRKKERGEVEEMK